MSNTKQQTTGYIDLRKIPFTIPANEIFTTHTGEIVTGNRLNRAFNKVADDLVNIAKGIRSQNLYASHVTEEQKETNLQKGLARAEIVRAGGVGSLGVWQRVNEAITGKCVALLP